MVEEKGNYAARQTGNVAIEVDILEKSKAHLFLIAFPIPTGWHGQVIDRLDIERLLNASESTHRGRFYKYVRKPAGQYGMENMLVPIEDLMKYGKPVTKFVSQLQHAPD